MNAVTVGGRYTVGPNPTYRSTHERVPCRVLKAGDVVIVQEVVEDGDVLAYREGDRKGYIHPDHLTPYTDPADVITAQASDVADWIRRLDQQATTFAAQRDAALQQLQDVRDEFQAGRTLFQGMLTMANERVERAEEQRDDRRAEVERLHTELDKVRAQRDRGYADHAATIKAARDALGLKPMEGVGDQREVIRDGIAHLRDQHPDQYAREVIAHLRDELKAIRTAVDILREATTPGSTHA